MAIHNQKHVEEAQNKQEEIKVKSENLGEDYKSETSDSGNQYKAMNLSSGELGIRRDLVCIHSSYSISKHICSEFDQDLWRKYLITILQKPFTL